MRCLLIMTVLILSRRVMAHMHGEQALELTGKPKADEQ